MHVALQHVALVHDAMYSCNLLQPVISLRVLPLVSLCPTSHARGPYESEIL
jgi:hypothetical protein